MLRYFYLSQLDNIWLQSNYRYIISVTDGLYLYLLLFIMSFVDS